MIGFLGSLFLKLRKISKSDNFEYVLKLQSSCPDVFFADMCLAKRISILMTKFFANNSLIYIWQM